MKEVSDDSTAGTTSAVSLLARGSMTLGADLAAWLACSGFIRATISEIRPHSVTDSPFASRALYVASRTAGIFKLAHYPSAHRGTISGLIGRYFQKPFLVLARQKYGDADKPAKWMSGSNRVVDPEDRAREYRRPTSEPAGPNERISLTTQQSVTVRISAGGSQSIRTRLSVWSEDGLPARGMPSAIQSCHGPLAKSTQSQQIIGGIRLPGSMCACRKLCVERNALEHTEVKAQTSQGFALGEGTQGFNAAIIANWWSQIRGKAL